MREEEFLEQFVKNNSFDFKQGIINHCRQLDKLDVYEWVAEDELKIQRLQQENQQLKERNKLLEKHYKQGEKNLGTQIDITVKYKSVLDEIREYINDNVAVYSFNNLDLPHWEFNDEDIRTLLQILDKVKEDENNEEKI